MDYDHVGDRMCEVWCRTVVAGLLAWAVQWCNPLCWILENCSCSQPSCDWSWCFNSTRLVRLQLIRHHRNRSVAEQSRAELLIQSPPPSLLHCSRICCCCCCWGLGYGNLRGSLPVPLLSSVAFIRSCTSLHCQERCLWLPVPAESRQTAAHVATNGQLVRRTHELLRSS